MKTLGISRGRHGLPRHLVGTRLCPAAGNAAATIPQVVQEQLAKPALVSRTGLPSGGKEWCENNERASG